MTLSLAMMLLELWCLFQLDQRTRKRTAGLSLAYGYTSPFNKARLAAATSVNSSTPINPSPLGRAHVIDKDEKIAQREL